MRNVYPHSKKSQLKSCRQFAGILQKKTQLREIQIHLFLKLATHGFTRDETSEKNLAIGEGKRYFRNAISIQKLFLGIIHYQTCDFDCRDFDQFPRIRVAGEMAVV